MKFKNKKQQAAVMARLKQKPVSSIKTTYENLMEHEKYGETVNAMVEHLRKGGTLPPILIDEDGELIDGRHRLAAYKRMGKPVIATVVGHSSQAYEIYDKKTGKKLDVKRSSIQGQPFAYIVKKPRHKCNK